MLEARSLVTVSLLALALASCAPAKGDAHEAEKDSGKNAPGFDDGFEDDFDAGGDGPFLGDAACAAVSEQANETPLSLYVMLDKSNSMEPRWDRAMAGLKAFFNDASSSGINVALTFFPRPPNKEQPECSSDLYMTPAVDFGLLPSHAPSLVAAIDGEVPDGRSTPVLPALGGAIRQSMSLADKAKADNIPASFAVLLVTDGEPEGACEKDHAKIAAHAKNGLAKGIKTFVVGLPPVNPAFANLVAEAGGTEKAILVQSNDVEGQFQKALAEVRGQALPCEFAIPEKVQDGSVAVTEVNVVLTPSTTKTPETLPQASDCSEGGWQYDTPKEPTKIVLCPSSCDAIKKDLQAKIDIELGCATIIR